MIFNPTLLFFTYYAAALRILSILLDINWKHNFSNCKPIYYRGIHHWICKFRQYLAFENNKFSPRLVDYDNFI